MLVSPSYIDRLLPVLQFLFSPHQRTISTKMWKVNTMLGYGITVGICCNVLKVSGTGWNEDGLEEGLRQPELPSSLDSTVEKVAG